jgi:dual specificity tyrosine-phosphorylation-regulated kinase 2/3/4
MGWSPFVPSSLPHTNKEPLQDAEEKHYVIKMTDHFYFRNHLCIAMELLSINLYELIKANGFVGFTTNLIRRFTTQMLMSLTLMRHHRIVHCDLKPEVRVFLSL